MYPPELIEKEARRLGLSPRTIKTYQNCVAVFFRRCRKEPFAISKSDINDFLDRMLEQNKPGNTINVYLNALKFFYEQVLHRRLTVNIKFSKTPKTLPEFLTQDEVKSLFAAIDNPKQQLLIKLLYSTGMRVSELTNLKVKNFEFEQNYGWVRQGKGRKDRLFIIAEKLKFELLDWIQSQQLNSDDYLFSGYGSSYSPSSVRMILRTAAKIAGINKNVHPHTLRHSFATHLIQNGYAVTEVQPLLGHSKLETTMIYLHLATPNLIKVKSPLDDLEK